MGIQGLLPFLKPATRPVHVKEFSGCTVAIDSYCWLHKGAFSCAEKLARGESTDQYVVYCMKFIKMLQSHDITPILVFDGRHLPAKAETEKTRRQRREMNRRKAAELLRQDRANEARSLIQRCVDVTPEMASNLIKKCRSVGVDCIVAPYEADAQLAFLSLNGIAHVVITEDSDLIIFGCKRVIFKMDLVGNGLLVEQEKIPLAMKQRPEQFTIDKFRHMCILSGCDYLQSLPGIGLQKALKFIKRTAETDISKALTRLGAHLNMSSLVVTPDYCEKFLQAELMFKHQPVFDPISRKVVPLTPIPEGMSAPLSNNLSDETNYQLALGNLDPFSLNQIDNWDPDKQTGVKTNSWQASTVIKNSVWSSGFHIPKPLSPRKDPREVKRTTTQGNCVEQNVDVIINKISVFNQKSAEDQVNELKELYTRSPPKKKSCLDVHLEEERNDLNTTMIEDTEESLDEAIASTLDIISPSPERKKVNPFSKTPNGKVKSKPSPCHSGLEGMARKVKRTILDESTVIRSRFFATNPDPPTDSEVTKPEEKEEDFDILAMILDDNGPEEKKEKKENERKNVFSTVKQSPSNNLYNNFSVKSDRPSFLKVIDSMSKFITEQEETKPKPSPKFNDKRRQSSMSGFVTSGLEAKNVKLTSPKKVVKSEGQRLKPTLQPARGVGLKRKKSTVQSDQKSILTMFAFQPRSKLNEV
ncbi:exonuclease 1 isoform X1 [Cimex lectularius]|uniref:Exonuclease 1 n=2 Tax=Cimex lectularius TaxID=79782 RepID=A0A8I6RCV5_CIMLE|nr:exonuclease 1 isoform X1 [Cimex lectularius]